MSDWVSYFKQHHYSLLQQSMFNRLLFELILERIPKGGRALEVGCGTANMSLLLADHGYSVVATDVDEDVIAYSRERIKLSDANIQFEQISMFELSSHWPDGYFELACHSGVMEHFSDEAIVRGLQEQRKVAKQVIFKVPNSKKKLSLSHFGDERFLDYDYWVKLIRSAGFDTIEVFGNYDFPRWTYLVFPGIFFRRRLSFWWKHVSKHTIFVCK